MKVLGEKLSEARTKKKLSYKTLHKRTKIAVETIQAIEEGKASHLPVTYFIAFVRTLAREVGLNPDSLIREYNSRQRRLLEEKMVTENQEGLQQKRGHFWEKWSRWVVLGMIGSTLLLLIGLYIVHGWQLFIEPDISDVNTPSDGSSTPVVISPDSSETDHFVLQAIGLNDTWMEVRVDSGPYEMLFIQRGEKTMWKMQNTIFVGLEDPKSIRLSLDGALLDWSGDEWPFGLNLQITGTGIADQSPRKKPSDDLLVEDNGFSPLLLIGQIDLDTLYQKFPVYRQNQMAYQPNSVVLSKTEDLDPHLDLICFLGTWDSLSEEIVPKLLRMLEMSYLPHVVLTIVGVNPTMEDGEGLARLHRVQGLPTILFLMSQIEIGRIVGQPGDRIESQFLDIVERGDRFLRVQPGVQQYSPRGHIEILE